MPESPSLPVTPIIAVEHVFKSVTDSTGTLDILRDIDFRLAPRETAAIVGASGSGKSTLLSIIAGLDTPTRGTVRLDGQDLFALSEDDRAALRAQKVGFVFQSFQLMGNLTALENVMLPLELAERRDARKAAAEMLERVGLGPERHRQVLLEPGAARERRAAAVHRHAPHLRHRRPLPVHRLSEGRTGASSRCAGPEGQGITPVDKGDRCGERSNGATASPDRYGNIVPHFPPCLPTRSQFRYSLRQSRLAVASSPDACRSRNSRMRATWLPG